MFLYYVAFQSPGNRSSSPKNSASLKHMFRGFAESGALGFDLANVSFQACFWTTTRHSLDFSKPNHNSERNACTNCLQDWVPRGWKSSLNHVLFAKAEGESSGRFHSRRFDGKAQAGFLLPKQRPHESPHLVEEKYNQPRKHHWALDLEPWITE